MLAKSTFLPFLLVLSRAAAASSSELVSERASAASLGEHTVARGAQATPSLRTSWTGDRLALLAHIGIGAPAGALGLDLDVAPIPYFALNVSVGRSENGAQYALMSRARLPIGTLAAKQNTYLTFGVGPSFGRYENLHSCAGLSCLILIGADGESPATQTFDRAVWYNLEFGLDVYSGEGRGFLRTTLGYGWISNDHDYRCVPSTSSGGYASGAGCDRDSGQALAFFSFAYGFDL